MTDRELLELAAKAVGISLVFFEDGTSGIPNDDDNLEECWITPWNPLLDDGDALRLAVRLGIEIVEFMDTIVPSRGVAWNHRCNSLWEPEDDDSYAATRRAIVRAAAEIGKEILYG